MAIIAGVKLGIYSSYEEAVKKACTFRGHMSQTCRGQRSTICYMSCSARCGLHNQQIWDYRHQMNKKIQAISEEE